jgi:hypothetical protein
MMTLLLGPLTAFIPAKVMAVGVPAWSVFAAFGVGLPSTQSATPAAEPLTIDSAPVSFTAVPLLVSGIELTGIPLPASYPVIVPS